VSQITLRITDTLSRELGHSMSINELTKKMGQSYGTAYYANTYRNIRKMLADGTINIQKTGKSSLVALNFSNYFVTDLLTELELRRKQTFLEKRSGLTMLLGDIDERFKDSSFIKSMSLINPEKNIRLDRIELLVITQNSLEDNLAIDYIPKMYSTIQALQRKHNIRIDLLTLSKGEFLLLLKSNEINPLREMLSDKITFFQPQSFWLDIRDAINSLEKRYYLRTKEYEINPSKISEDELIYNLTRFGYKEIGSQIKQGTNICIEYIITSILMKNEARRINAIPVILSKNKVNYNLLVFLCQKYRVSDKLLGLLRTLSGIKPTEEIKLHMKVLEALEIREIKADERSIREKMVLYNAT